MPAKLICRTGQLSKLDYEINEEATIGTTADNDIVLHPKVISGNHARIYYDKQNQCYVIEDLNSRNGTELDGVYLDKSERLSKLHVITFAKTYDFIFQHLTSPEAKAHDLATEPSHEPESPPEQKTVFSEDPAEFPGPLPPLEEKESTTASEPDQTRFEESPEAIPEIPEIDESKPEPQETAPTLIDQDVGKASAPPGIDEIKEEDTPPTPPSDDEPTRPKDAPTIKPRELVVAKIDRSFKLKMGENIVGRTVECDIFIEDVSVSRRHAVIACTPDQTTVEDLGSKNHTFVNGKMIDSVQTVEPGTELTFGDVSAVLQYHDA